MVVVVVVIVAIVVIAIIVPIVANILAYAYTKAKAIVCIVNAV